MPTGQALQDARSLLLDAGRRVLAARGASALTTRTVTEASGVAKGVLHRHFADFDTYVAALVAEEALRIDRIEPRVADSAPAAVTDVIEQIFTPTMLALVSLVIGRDGVRRRVQSDEAPGIPLLADATSAVADVLAAGREVGWIRSDADTGILALSIVGSAHLVYAGRWVPPDHDAVHRVVESLLAGSL